ncbi:MAG: PorT family protein [Bacteroidetes bacterium]|nr:PorT family protein [Bacteroidota bacterium]
MTFNPIRCLSISCLLLTSSMVSSQKTSFGFYVGPTRSTLNLEPRAALPVDVQIDPYDFKTGFTAGGHFTLIFAQNVGLRAELNFERKGGKSGLPLSDGNGNPLPDYSIKDNSDYLQLPVMFELSAGTTLKMHIHAGYAFSYLLHNTDNFPNRINVVTPTQTIILLMPERYKKIDHSLVAGIAASYPLNDFLRLQLAGRVFYGKLNLSEGEGAFEARNLSVAMLAGLQFEL